jgi:hypothetical protein
VKRPRPPPESAVTARTAEVMPHRS